MLLHPFLSNYEDNNYYSTPRSYHENLRRAMAVEDMRRRAELERYYRAQNARRQRNLPFGDDEIYQTLLQRQALEREAERQDYNHAMRYLRGDDDEDSAAVHHNPLFLTVHENHHRDERPSYRLVRGPDGRVYRIPSQKTSGMGSYSRSQTQMNEGPSTPDMKRVHNEKFVKVARDTSEKETTDRIPFTTAEERQFNDIENTKGDGLKAGVNTEYNTVKITNAQNHKERTKKVGSVIVEDASDDEDDDGIKSPWRNRRPSPGEWMEPVAMFDKMSR